MATVEQNDASPLTGRWRITAMSAWDRDHLDVDGPASIEFDAHGGGAFRFVLVHGDMDCRLATRGRRPAVEWTWDGRVKEELAHGRGWAVLKGGGLRGMIFFHQGYESEFVATRMEANRH